MEKITHNGGFSTITDFRLENGTQVRIEVWFSTQYTVSNKSTSYNFNLSTKNKGYKKWTFQFRSENSLDKRAFEYITEQQLYKAYFNHWKKINPIRLFSGGSMNSELINFKVNEIPTEQKHYLF